jgi:hypothetical protein
MKTEGSLPRSQQRVTDPYPEPDKSNINKPTPCYFRIHFNIVLTPSHKV